ncbi:MAG: hypothetical protein AAGA60_30335, partial [Cyanobacteria bacterium P01_E01_bin.42]
WEYPFWVLVQSQADRSTYIQHIHVDNISTTTKRKLNRNLNSLCAILTIDREIKQFQVTQWGIYKQKTQPIPLSFSGYLQIYQKPN